MASCVITGNLVEALRGMAKVRSGYHTLLMREGREEIRQKHGEAADTGLGEARTATCKPDAQQMGRIQRTGTWLSVLPPTVNGTELGAQEWRDSLFLRYGIDPPDLPSHYNSCWAAFSICNALDRN